jgi:hypothetical protein
MEDLHVLIDRLSKRCDQLEEEVKILKKNSRPLTSKDYIRELNVSYSTNCTDFEQWKQSITITEKHIKSLMESDACTVYSEIVCDNYESDKGFCMKAFENKKSIFIFKNDIWTLMNKTEIQELMNVIYNKIIKVFNGNTNTPIDKNLDYLERVQKIMAIKKVTTNCLKNKIYSLLTES